MSAFCHTSLPPPLPLRTPTEKPLFFRLLPKKIKGIRRALFPVTYILPSAATRPTAAARPEHPAPARSLPGPERRRLSAPPGLDGAGPYLPRRRKVSPGSGSANSARSPPQQPSGRGRTGKSPSAAGQPALILQRGGRRSPSYPPSPSAPQAPSPRGEHLPPRRGGGQAAPTRHREFNWCERGPGR